MKSNQVDLVYGLLAVLVIMLIGEYYLYYNFEHSVELSKPLAAISAVSKRIGPIVRIGFIVLYFFCILLVSTRGGGMHKVKYSVSAKIFVVSVTLAFAFLFIIVTRLPYVKMLYPVFFFGYLIGCVFIPRIYHIGVLLKDDFSIKTDTRAIENKYSFSLPTEDGVINIPNPFAGILVLGAAGSGKSVSVAEPVIEQMTAKEYSGLVYDFKFPTLTSKVFTEMSKRASSNVEICIVNFHNLKKSHRVNIFAKENIPEVTYAFEYTTALINNLLPESIRKKDFWIRSASTLLTATIWYLRKHHPSYCTLPHVVDLICNGNAEDLIMMLGTDMETSGMVKNLQEAVDKKAGNQLAGVLATLQSTLVTINNPKIFWVLTGNDFSMNLNDPKKPKMLCIGTSPDTADSLSPVVSCMVTVATKQMNQSGKHHSIVLLDEAPQIFIPKLSNLPATARSNKVVTMFMAQTIQQIVQLYSQEEADAILGNLSTQFYGRSRDVKSSEYVSRVFGKMDKVNSSFSTNTKQNDSSSFGRNDSLQLKELVKSQDIYNLKTGHFYGVTIEAEHPTFYGKIVVPDPTTVKLKEIPEFSPDATDEAIKRNYERVRLEIQAILAGEIEAETEKGKVS